MTTSWRRLSLVTVLSGLLPTQAQAAGVSTVEYLRDVQNQLSIDTIREQGGWAPIAIDSINLGMSSDPFWLKVNLATPPERIDHLVVENPVLDSVTLYRPHVDGLHHAQVQGFLAGATNQFGNRHLVFDLTTGTTGPYYMKVETRGPLQIPITVRQGNDLESTAREDNAVFGAMFAVLCSFALYNALIFLSVRRSAYIYYAGYTACLAALFMTTEGVLPRFIGGPIRPLAVHLSGGIGFACLILFTRKLLGTRRFIPRFDLVLKCLVGTTLAIPIGATIADGWLWSALGAVDSTVAAICCLTAGVLCVRRRRVAWIFVASFAAPLLGSTLYVAQIFQSVPTNAVTLHAVHIGACIEAILFSQALALVINDLNRRITRKSRFLVRANAALSEEIVERKRISEELEKQRAIIIHTAKMRELGTIAAAIAHEINTPLTVLKLVIDRLDAPLASPSAENQQTSLAKSKETSAKMITRIMTVMRNMLNFARDSGGDAPDLVAANAIVDDLADVCRASLAYKNVEFTIGDIPQAQIRCRPGDISQILINLINNAADALTGRESPEINVLCTLEASSIAFRVEDNGPGVPEELVSKLMNESFTTKPVGQGTGFGLGIARLLAQRNGGSLSYERHDGITAFVFRVPLADQPADVKKIA